MCEKGHGRDMRGGVGEKHYGGDFFDAISIFST